MPNTWSWPVSAGITGESFGVTAHPVDGVGQKILALPEPSEVLKEIGWGQVSCAFLEKIGAD